MRLIRKAWQRTRSAAARLFGDRSGIAATEFAVIAPVMLITLFGVIEITNGVTAYRKVTIVAHTLSDLTSQSATVDDSDLNGFFCSSVAIMNPYVTLQCPTSSINQTITEVWVNGNLQPRVQWSVGSAPLSPGNSFPNLPSNLLVANTYIIYSQVSFTYVPAFGYVMNQAGVTLSDFAYTRPRQNACVPYAAGSTEPPPPSTTPCTGI